MPTRPRVIKEKSPTKEKLIWTRISPSSTASRLLRLFLRPAERVEVRPLRRSRAEREQEQLNHNNLAASGRRQAANPTVLLRGPYYEHSFAVASAGECQRASPGRVRR